MARINLFHSQTRNIKLGYDENRLHGGAVTEFEEVFKKVMCEAVADRVHAVSFSSASMAIQCSLPSSGIANVPALIPPVVPIHASRAGLSMRWVDNPDWVGTQYTLYNERGINIIDSAQTAYRGHAVDCNITGSGTRIIIYSFYPTKPVGGIDGGMVLTNDREVADYLRIMTMNGTVFEEESWNRETVCLGYKAYMSVAQAKVAWAELLDLDRKNEALARLNTTYYEDLGYRTESRHLYRIEVDPDARPETIQYLEDQGISTGIHYHALHNHRVLGRLAYDSGCDKSAKAARKTLTLPFHSGLSKADTVHIIKHVKKAPGFIPG